MAGGGRAAQRGAEWWKGRADPSPYRIVEEIRLVQVPQVQEAGSGEQPVRREGLQDGVHRGGLRRPLGLGFPHSRAAARPARSSCWRLAGARGQVRGSAPREGRAGAALPRAGGAGGAGGLGRGGGRAQGRWAHRRHSADSSSSGSSGGTAGFHGEPGSGAEGWRSPPDWVGAGGGGAERSPETGGCRVLCSLRVSLGLASVTFLCETGNPGLVSTAGQSATPPHQYSR